MPKLLKLSELYTLCGYIITVIKGYTFYGNTDDKNQADPYMHIHCHRLTFYQRLLTFVFQASQLEMCRNGDQRFFSTPCDTTILSRTKKVTISF